MNETPIFDIMQSVNMEKLVYRTACTVRNANETDTKMHWLSTCLHFLNTLNDKQVMLIKQ